MVESEPGAFIGGEVIGQLVLVLALGTVGTPFAIAVVLYLLNAESAVASNSALANFGGLALLTVSGGLAANFVREQLATGLDLLSGLVLAFALVLAAATFVFLGQYVHEEVSPA